MAETLTPPQTRVEQSWRMFWTGLLRDNPRRTKAIRSHANAIGRIGVKSGRR